MSVVSIIIPTPLVLSSSHIMSMFGGLSKYLSLKIFSSLVLFFLSSNLAVADGQSVGLITGSPGGTYIKIGQDISRLSSDHGLSVNVFESNGSLANIAAVFERVDVQMGLVQSDVLGYLRESQNKKLGHIEDNIKMMFPLYNEEIHILATKNIKSIDDLSHKRVGVGSRGSGTNLTSDLLFEVTDVWPQKKFHLDAVSALSALEGGEIDAMIYVSGYPVSLFSGVDGNRFHLIPVSGENVSEYYFKSTIPPLTYSWQSDAVNTVAVKAVLMSFDFRGKYCDSAKKMADIIYNNLSWLKANGHSKWNDVNLDYNLNKWDRYDCIQ